MRPLIAAESTLTDRYQTTVPDPVRRALNLGKRDKIRYDIRDNGEVVLSRAIGADEGDDPVLGRFLVFLADDIARHPERVQALDAAFVQRVRLLTAGVAIDLDEALAPDDE